MLMKKTFLKLVRFVKFHPWKRDCMNNERFRFSWYIQKKHQCNDGIPCVWFFLNVWPMKITYTLQQGALNYLKLLTGKLRGLVSISEWMHPRLYFPSSETEEHELFCPWFTTNHYKLTLKSRRQIGNTVVGIILPNPEWAKAFENVCSQ